MQNADTYLGILRERGKRGLPVERVYRQLFNRELYLKAYGRIYRGRATLIGEKAQATLRGRPRGRLGTEGSGKGCLRGRPRGR